MSSNTSAADGGPIAIAGANGSRPGINRRAAFGRISSGVLLSLGFWPGASRADNETGTQSFRFLVVNDLHFSEEACAPFFARLIAQMKRHEPAFVLLAGDLSDRGEREQLLGVKTAVDRLGCPYYVQLGNHDYASRSDRSAYEEIFPGRINYSFSFGGWQFVGLDSTQGTEYQNTRIQPATLGWCDDQCPKLNPRQPTVLFTHFPLGAGVTYRPANADALLDRWRDFNLLAVFNGHYHGFTERHAMEAVVTTNKCCSRVRGNHDQTAGKGYFLCTATPKGLQREYVEFEA